MDGKVVKLIEIGFLINLFLFTLKSRTVESLGGLKQIQDYE